MKQYSFSSYEQSQTKKGNQWHFGAKMHVGVDAHSDLVHTARLTKASRHAAALMDELLADDDKAVFGPSGILLCGTLPGNG